MGEKSDPTKDPEFQKVIRHFVTTPHKLHEPLKGNKRKIVREDGTAEREATPAKELRVKNSKRIP